jgi:hypothetical protein
MVSHLVPILSHMLFINALPNQVSSMLAGISIPTPMIRRLVEILYRLASSIDDVKPLCSLRRGSPIPSVPASQPSSAYPP